MHRRGDYLASPIVLTGPNPPVELSGGSPSAKGRCFDLQAGNGGGNGKLAAYYEYDSWGNTMIMGACVKKTAVDNLYRYSTKERDEKCGLYYFGARYYYPEIGRWRQRDPAGIVNGLNLYLYVVNSPRTLWSETVGCP